jgi:hypothetical protein
LREKSVPTSLEFACIAADDGVLGKARQEFVNKNTQYYADSTHVSFAAQMLRVLQTRLRAKAQYGTSAAR